MSVRKILDLICEEPYRLFFPLGILIGSWGAGHWFFYGIGWIKNYSAFFHTFTQIHAFMGCFIIGFLLTAMPRFASAPPATGKEIGLFLSLTLAIVFFLSTEQWIPAELSYVSWLISLLMFARRRFKQKRSEVMPPVEFVWIPAAVIQGVVGTLLLIAGQLKLVSPRLTEIGKEISEQGFVFSIVIGVAGFLIPRLIGRFEPNPGTSEEIHRKRRLRIKIHLAAAFLFFLSFWLEKTQFEACGYVIRASIMTAQFLWTKALPKPPRVSDLFAWLAWISIWFVCAGIWLTAFFIAYKKVTLHFAFIGGFSLMIVAIATMVTLSHAGEAHSLKKPLWILKLIFFGMLIALGLRVSAVFFANEYFKLLAAASGVWILSGFLWLCFALPHLIRIPSPEAFERSHEEAKKRIAEASDAHTC